MPELPEVETVVLGLRQVLIGHRIVAIDSDWPQSLPIDPSDCDRLVIGARIESVSRRGKLIIIGLDTNHSLIVHLKMTGQLVYLQSVTKKRFGGGHPTDSLIARLPDKTTRVICQLDNGGQLFFNDSRKFGWVTLAISDYLTTIKSIRTQATDGLKIEPAELIAKLAHRRKTIKACLLDQTIIAGCGNIYADESLWMTAIHPSQPAGDLSPDQITKLLANLKRIFKISLAAGGSSSRNYVNAQGQKGRYLDFAKAYGRAGQPCWRCRIPLVKIRVANRGSSICPNCQVLR